MEEELPKQDLLKTDLIERARAGDSAARDQLAVGLLPKLQAIVALNVGSKMLQQESKTDVVQSVFREVLEDLADFRGSSAAQFRAWVQKVALNKIRMKGRRGSAARRDPGKVQGAVDVAAMAAACTSLYSPSHHAALAEQQERLEAAFQRLAPEYREVLTLVKILELSHAQAGAEMGRSEDAMRQLLRRAMARLSLELGAQS